MHLEFVSPLTNNKKSTLLVNKRAFFNHRHLGDHLGAFGISALLVLMWLRFSAFVPFASHEGGLSDGYARQLGLIA